MGDLLAVGLHLRLALYVLLRLNDLEGVAKPFVIDDGCVTYKLVLSEHTVGKTASVPTHIYALACLQTCNSAFMLSRSARVAESQSPELLTASEFATMRYTYGDPEAK